MKAWYIAIRTCHLCFRGLSVEPEKPALHGSNAHADHKEHDASRLNASAKAINALGNRQLDLGHRQSNANVLAPTAKRFKQALSAPDVTAEGPLELRQYQMPDTSVQLQSSQSNGAQPSAVHRHTHPSGRLGHKPTQNGQHTHAEGMLHDSSMNSSASHPHMQHHNVSQKLPSQPAWSTFPSSDNNSQPGQVQRLQQPATSSHKPKQPVNALAAAHMPYANGTAVNQSSGHTHPQSSHVPTMWSPMNGYRTMHGSEGVSAHRPRSGGWHMPDSKRQVSVNALARSSYGS